ncbi:adenosine deaminase [Amycolatopsis sp. WGS_07]|uniref:adenosine deaminase n=1 Tax=Amycolatopsis sp. WGS_07 TaxID=3076764 RepID=UPI00387313BB
MTPDEFVAALPKAELHVHLLGSASPSTVAELARRHPGRGVPTESAEVAKYCEFTDFAHFLAVYTAVNRLVTTGADIEALVAGLAADLARDNVRYAEVTVTPLSHRKSGIAPRELAEALDSGRRIAGGLGVELSWVFDVSGDDGLPGAEATLEWVLRESPSGTVGFGLGGPEAGVPRRLFRDVFARAKAAGLHSVPHAGETTGPDEVWSAIRDLGAERVGHGIASARDPRLLRHLADHGITLEICPTSNLRTRAVPSLAEHPLRRILDAGVPVALGTDDPGLFGTSPNAEFRTCRDRLGLSEAELATLVRHSVAAAFCTPAVAAGLLSDLDRLSLARSV